MRAGMELLGREISPELGKRMCLDKKQFYTRNEARDFASRGFRQLDHTHQKPYKCRLCGYFHLTTVSKKPRKKEAK